MQITSNPTPPPVQPGQEFVHQMTCDGTGPFAWSIGPGAQSAGFTIDYVGVIRWTPGANQTGVTRVDVSVMDQLGGQASQELLVSVWNVNITA